MIKNRSLNDRLFFIVQGILKYLPFQCGISLRSFFYKFFFARYGENIKIKDGATFKYPSEIEIGNNVTIGEFCYFVGKSGLVIGDDVLIGAGSKLITSSHKYVSRQLPINQQGLEFARVELESDIWLGFDVKVLAGSYIAKGCIVGAGSIINSSFRDEYKKIVGSPARVVGDRP